MTTAILGPGAVGASLAVRLALAGERVICVARLETAAAVRDDGLTLVYDGEELMAQVRDAWRVHVPDESVAAFHASDDAV